VVDVEKCVAFERTGEGKCVAMCGGYFEGCVCASMKSATYGSGWEIGDCRCVDGQRMLGGRYCVTTRYLIVIAFVFR
jgi:hypothetical protein